MTTNAEKELEEFITFNEFKTSQLQIKSPATKSNIRKDLKNIILLLFLYMLQGIPLGLGASMPFILGARKISLSDQGIFSFSFWPFSIKLLWAPIVDSVFCNKLGCFKLGRRKSWLIPVQLLIGVLMFSTANLCQKLLNKAESRSDIILLTSIFVIFNTLAATQDIAVDGWAISMLHKENVGWQSLCNGVGQTTGFFLGNYIFIVLESTKFCNDYIRPVLGLAPQDHGIITMKWFMYVFGFLYLFSTILVLIFKNEEPYTENRLSTWSAYLTIWKMLKVKKILKVAFILLTIKIGICGDSVSFLKFLEMGVSKEKLSLLAIPITPIYIIWPLLISKFTSGPNAFITYGRVYPFKLISSLCIFLYVYFTPYFKDPITNQYETKYYLICFVITAINVTIESTMFVSQMAFFAKISDETVGGTYMTFLATLANLGGTYTGTGILFVTDLLTFKKCSFENSSLTARNNFYVNGTIIKCSSKNQKLCTELGGKCITTFDAYNYLAIILPVIGLVWIICFNRLITKLNNTPKNDWKLQVFN